MKHPKNWMKHIKTIYKDNHSSHNMDDSTLIVQLDQISYKAKHFNTNLYDLRCEMYAIFSQLLYRSKEPNTSLLCYIHTLVTCSDKNTFMNSLEQLITILDNIRPTTMFRPLEQCLPVEVLQSII